MGKKSNETVVPEVSASDAQASSGIDAASQASRRSSAAPGDNIPSPPSTVTVSTAESVLTIEAERLLENLEHIDLETISLDQFSTAEKVMVEAQLAKGNNALMRQTRSLSPADRLQELFRDAREGDVNAFYLHLKEAVAAGVDLTTRLRGKTLLQCLLGQKKKDEATYQMTQFLLNEATDVVGYGKGKELALPIMVQQVSRIEEAQLSATDVRFRMLVAVIQASKQTQDRFPLLKEQWDNIAKNSKPVWVNKAFETALAPQQDPRLPIRLNLKRPASSMDETEPSTSLPTQANKRLRKP